MLRMAALFMCLAVGPAGAAFSDSDKGGAGAGFLRVAPGARGAALGEAYSSLGDEASVLFWNPAALTQATSTHCVSFTHGSFLDIFSLNFMAYSFKKDSQVLGVGVHTLTTDSFDRTDVSGNTVGTLRPRDEAYSLAYARKLTDGEKEYALGFTFKMVRSKIARRASGYTADAGLLSPRFAGGTARAALVIQNMGGSLKFHQDAAPMPTTVRLGGHWLWSGTWVWSAELILPRGNGPSLGLGTEKVFYSRERLRLAGRMGFNSRNPEDVGGLAGPSFGIGLENRMVLDYALVPLGTLGLTHRVSVRFPF